MNRLSYENYFLFNNFTNNLEYSLASSIVL